MVHVRSVGDKENPGIAAVRCRKLPLKALAIVVVHDDLARSEYLVLAKKVGLGPIRLGKFGLAQKVEIPGMS